MDWTNTLEYDVFSSLEGLEYNIISTWYVVWCGVAWHER